MRTHFVTRISLETTPGHTLGVSAITGVNTLINTIDP